MGRGAKRAADIVAAMLLPHLADRMFITDGGMETTLIFHRGPDLPHFRRSSSSTATASYAGSFRV